MKELLNKFISNLHYLIIAYGLWGAYEMYETHTVELEQITSQVSAIESEIVNLEQKVKEIQDFKDKTEEYKIRVEEVAKNIETVQKQLPAEISDPQILTYFNQEMTVLNIKDPNLVPGKEESSTYYISKDYTLKAKGTFLQFLIFFERIGNAARIYNVKSLKLVAVEEKKRGRFQIVSGEGVIQAFRYNPSFKVDRGFKDDGQMASQEN